MLEQTTGVSVFVLRRTPIHETEVLLLKGADGVPSDSWSLVGGPLRPDEREAEAALRELFEATALEPERLYAAAFSGFDEENEPGVKGRVGVFVAYVGDEVEVAPGAGRDGFVWCSVRDAASRLARGSDRQSVARVVTDFVRQAPDESLRIL